MTIPYDSADISLRKVGKFFQIKSSVCDIDLRFDGKVTATLDVPSDLNRTTMLGLCGDCDGAQTEAETVMGINETGTYRSDRLFSFFHIIPDMSSSVYVKGVVTYVCLFVYLFIMIVIIISVIITSTTKPTSIIIIIIIINIIIIIIIIIVVVVVVVLFIFFLFIWCVFVGGGIVFLLFLCALCFDFVGVF